MLKKPQFELSGLSLIKENEFGPSSSSEPSEIQGKWDFYSLVTEVLIYWIVNNSKCEITGSPIAFFNPVIPTYKPTRGSRNPEVYFGIPCISRSSRLSHCFKMPSPELQIREIPHPEKPNGVHQIKPDIIRYLGPHIDCVLHLWNSPTFFLEISESEYPKYHRSRNIIHESAKIFALSSIKTQHKLGLMISQTFRREKYFSKIMNLKLSKSKRS